ncbi:MULTISPECIES: DUF4234 domain-containing protein [unclassified Serratia (in: enterobacteria)]|uniref:DUF4234 domain-containing protein n=1 Tax=unclassified Serratia (in: enterobacteria) TaxID=2647522 RepID=UPI0030761793
MSTPSVSSLKEKINTSTWHLALLTFATGGIYPLLWLYKHQDTLMQETGQRFSSRALVIWMAVCFGIAAVLRPMAQPVYDDYRYNSSYETLAILVFLLSLAAAVLYAVWAFKARSALQHYALTQFRFELKMNLAWTLFFNIYYINYCINAMPEALAKHQIIHGKPEPTAASEQE